MLKRIDSSAEKVAYYQRRTEECLCRGEMLAGKRLQGIVLKVFSARHYDGIRCLVAWDSLVGGNPVFSYHDILDIDVY